MTNMMKRFILFLAALLTFGTLAAQNALNEKADNIVGTYSGAVKEGNKFRVKIVKLTDGTYRGQVIWMDNAVDEHGNKLLDVKNPDKSLRSKPLDNVVLFSGLKYNAKKQCWDDAKIYDARRGIRARMMAEFTADGRLRIKGSLMGISESVYWNKEQKAEK